MHYMKLKAAVSKYAELTTKGLSPDEIRGLIGQDEKQFTPEEVEEIYQAIQDKDAEGDKSGDGNSNAGKENPGPRSSEPPAKETIDDSGYVTCEEWRIEYVNGKLEKLKRLRTNVKLQPHQVEELNKLTNEHHPIKYYPVEA